MNFLDAVSGFLLGPSPDRIPKHLQKPAVSGSTPPHELGDPSKLQLEQMYNTGALPMPRHLKPLQEDGTGKHKLNFLG
jgi:hypothetical protein